MTGAIQGFAAIPRALLYDPSVPSDAKLVYLVLSSHVGSNESAWPSHARMAGLIGISKSTVKRMVGWLADHGHIEVIRRPLAAGNYQSNEYRLIAGSATERDQGQTRVGSARPQGQPDPRVTQTLGSDRPHTLGSQGTRVGSERAPNESQGKRVNTERASERSVRLPPNVDEVFERFWEIYPRREGKGAAKAAFVRVLRRGTPLDTVLAGAERLRDDPNLPERQFVCHPTTWLNQERWADDPLPPRIEDRREPPRPAPRPSAGLTVDIPIASAAG